MKIRLTKRAQWGGEVRNVGTSHDLPTRVATKLVDRGFAVVDDGKVKDASGDGCGSVDLSEHE